MNKYETLWKLLKSRCNDSQEAAMIRLEEEYELAHKQATCDHKWCETMDHFGFPIKACVNCGKVI